MPETLTAIHAARPTIAVDGEDTAFLAAGLLGLLVHETACGLSRCEAVFGNWGNKDGRVGFLFFDRDVLEFGKPFAIKVGDTTLFDGRITALEAHFPEGRPPEIAVLAEDRLQDLRMTRRTRTFADIADAAVFSQIASDHGLTPQIDVSGPTHKVLAQVNQSDLAFLRDRARAIGAEVWVEGRTLRAQPRTARAAASPVRLRYGGQLREFQVLADLAHQRTSVTVGGWDVSGKSALSVEATSSAIQSELGNDESGVSILGDTIGDRKDAVAHGVPVTHEEARARAEACFRTFARRFVTGRGVAQADGTLRVGVSADFEGLGPLFDGKYYIAEVRHLFDGVRGLRTEFAAERPGIGRA